jgi:hypothetical protein
MGSGLEQGIGGEVVGGEYIGFHPKVGVEEGWGWGLVNCEFLSSDLLKV